MPYATIEQFPRSIAFGFLLSIAISCYGGAAGNKTPLTIECFTISEAPPNTGNNRSSVKLPGVKYTRYELDRINRLHRELSHGLPTDPDKAKELVLRRFQLMNTAVGQQLENAANGLIKAMQYGIDRYPAIVFDGKAVVYGITDIRAATQVYRQWQAGEPRS